MLTCKPDGSGDGRGVGTPDDKGWITVDHAVPYSARVTVITVERCYHLAVQACTQGAHATLVDSLLLGRCCLCHTEMLSMLTYRFSDFGSTSPAHAGG